MLRHRVLRRLVVHLGDARSDDLIAPILFLAEGERGLRHYIGSLALRIAKLRLAFEYGRWSNLLNLDDGGLDRLPFRVSVALAHVDRLLEWTVCVADGRRRLLC